MNITQFKGEYFFLSNFWRAPITYRGIVFPSVENAFQASKIKDYSLDSIFAKIGPAEAKKLGHNVILRPGWEKMKLDLMETLLRIKFKDKSLKEQLLKTKGSDLYEGNHWGDAFWGCHWETLEGQNYLGKILMKIRDE